MLAWKKIGHNLQLGQSKNRVESNSGSVLDAAKIRQNMLQRHSIEISFYFTPRGTLRYLSILAILSISISLILAFSTVPMAFSQYGGRTSDLIVTSIVQTTTGPNSATVTYNATVIVDGITYITSSCAPNGTGFSPGNNLVT